MNEDPGKKQLNAWLREKNIPHTVSELRDNRTLCPDCGPVLLELFNSSASLPAHARTVLADALFARKLKASDKKEAIEAFLKFIKENAGLNIHWMSIVVLNGFAKNVSADKVHEIGQMAMDEKYNNLRPELTHVLYRIGNAEAVAYLLKAARDPVTAPLALDGLARLRVDGTLELCEEALKHEDMLYKDAIKDTYRKLKRQLAKKPTGPSHITTDAVPNGLEEWSTNLDGPELPKVLRQFKKLVQEGFSKNEIQEVVLAADNLSFEQTVRLKFPVTVKSGQTVLWLELFCDDENAYDLYVFGEPAFISKIEEAVKIS
jgi:hypothetical protein